MNLSPTQNTCLFTDGNKASVWETIIVPAKRMRRRSGAVWAAQTGCEAASPRSVSFQAGPDPSPPTVRPQSFYLFLTMLCGRVYQRIACRTWTRHSFAGVAQPGPSRDTSSFGRADSKHPRCWLAGPGMRVSGRSVSRPAGMLPPHRVDAVDRRRVPPALGVVWGC